jgi:multiple sugar transport system substrate-binding protein
VDGKLYGINLGNNSHSLIFNKAAYAKAGVPEPEFGMTWDQLIERATAITKAHDDDYFGVSNGSLEENAFENWLRQRGKALYTAEGKLAFDENDAGEWFDLWAKARDAKACPAANIQAMDKNNIETSLLTQNRAATVFNHSNQFVGYQVVNQNKLGLSTYPQGAGPNSGQYLKPSMMWSVYARSKAKEEAVKFANFTVKDPEGAKAMGAERGAPASPDIQKAVAGSLDEIGRTAVEFVAMVSDRVGLLPPAPPKGGGEIQTLLRRIGEQVGFGRLTPAEGGKKYVSDAKLILARG